jgi:hypothetical protein
MVLTMKPIALIVALVAAAGASQVSYEKDAIVAGGARVAYPDLCGDWGRFSPALKKAVRDGGLGLLQGERLPLPVEEWDAAAGKNVWRQPATATAELGGHWREIAGAWLNWRSGALQKKSCKKDGCTLTVVFESGEGASLPYALGVTIRDGAVTVDAIECAGPIRGVLRLVEKGEAQWRPYAKVLQLPDDSAPSSEYSVQDHCYAAADAARQPTVSVKLGEVSGRIDTISVSQGPWPGVTVKFGAKKIENVTRQRVGAR